MGEGDRKGEEGDEYRLIREQVTQFAREDGDKAGCSAGRGYGDYEKPLPVSERDGADGACVG